MQTRRRTSTSNLSLTLALPSDSPSLKRRSSYSSMSSVHSSRSPHTPRSSCGPQTPLMFKFDHTNNSSGVRNSTGSWASSTHEVDEIEFDWKRDQLALLNKTLEALPNLQVLTPYAGPVPPSNLLDKVSRTICSSKGPLEWPHSVRATRIKLVELSRLTHQPSPTRRMTTRASMNFDDAVMSIPEEEEEEKENGLDMDIDELVSGVCESDQESTLGKAAGRRKVAAMADATGTARSKSPRRKPLYRQNSMDFLADLPSVGASLPRLSTRLQRTSRGALNTTGASYHPYTRERSNSVSVSGRSPSPRAVTPTKFEVTPLKQRQRPPTLKRAATTISNVTVSAGTSNRKSKDMPAPPTPPPASPTRRSTRNRNIVSPTPQSADKTKQSAAALRKTRSCVQAMEVDPPAKLKRAPTYGACPSTTATASSSNDKMQVDTDLHASKNANDVSNAPLRSEATLLEEDEQKRGVAAKRARTRSGGSTTTERGDTVSKKEKSSKKSAPPAPAITATTPCENVTKPSATLVTPLSPTRRSTRTTCVPCANTNKTGTAETPEGGGPLLAVISTTSPRSRVRPRARATASATGLTRSENTNTFGMPLPGPSEAHSKPQAGACKPIVGVDLLRALEAASEVPGKPIESLAKESPESPSSSKTLRRVNKMVFSTTKQKVARRISYGSLVAAANGPEQGDGAQATGEGLESPIKLT